MHSDVKWWMLYFAAFHSGVQMTIRQYEKQYFTVRKKIHQDCLIYCY